jgi:putative membrane protein
LLCKAGENKDTKDSLEILAKKFARGEITEEEYRRIRDILTG